ncbi:7390_t:CDS:2 [Ambispora gerdemannii]|uniref:7390_t:CDS:1 n=1 Tax=Ambispora gerdemannii TaxID=144530 RepID=A0A9N8V3J1_9GLOM|nr:7390_t:CDS:2 [Ambispora gerdemannii]
MNPTSTNSKEINQSTDPGIAVLSFFVSVLGACTALELLGRRTSHVGAINWLLLLGAASSMGFVGMWATHFTGMKALVLDDGDPLTQADINYDSRFTILSLVLPIVVLILAFCAIGSQPKVNLSRILIGGTIAGLNIVLMHFCIQLAVIQYDVQYNIGTFIAATIIALVASNASLYLFFAMRAKWRSDWYKRLGCASIMAIAVTGMHYTASVGTRYYLKATEVNAQPEISSYLILGLVAMASIIAIVILVSITFIARAADLKTKRHAQKVVLGVAIYNGKGSILVSNEGFIPFRKITNEYSQQNLEDEFTISHPIFQWLYRLTHDWKSIEQWLPTIDRHIEAIDNHETNIGKVPYPILFREQFIINAKHLAESLELPLEQSGILYDNILNTGNLEYSPQLSFVSSKNSDISFNLDKSDEIKLNKRADEFLGKGQMLFLVQKVTEGGEDHFHRLGYRFVEPHLVAPLMAANIRVDNDTMHDYLDSMRIYANDGQKPQLQVDSVYTGLLVIQPRVKGLQVLVSTDARHQIPVAQLPSFKKLSDIEKNYINHISGVNLMEFSTRLGRQFPEVTKNVPFLNLNDLLPPNSPTKITSLLSPPISPIRTTFSSRAASTLVSRESSNDDLKGKKNLTLTTIDNHLSLPELKDFNLEFLQSLNQLISTVDEKKISKNALLFPQISEIRIPQKGGTAELILFTLLLSHDQRPNLSSGDVTFVPYPMFHTYQDVIYQTSTYKQQAWHRKVDEELGEVVHKALYHNVTKLRSDSLSTIEKFPTNGLDFMVFAQQEVVEEVVIVTDEISSQFSNECDNVKVEEIETKNSFEDGLKPNYHNSNNLDNNESDDNNSQRTNSTYHTFDDEMSEPKEHYEDDLKRASTGTFIDPGLTTTISTWNEEKWWFEEIVRNISGIEFDSREEYTTLIY